MSLTLVAPDLSFWSDTFDVGWDAHLVEEVASSLWSPEEVDLSINARELFAVERGLLSFQALLVDSTVSIFVDNATAVAYLRKQGGTRSSTLNANTQRISRWTEPLCIIPASQFIMGRYNSLSCPNQILGSEWTLKMEVFWDLRRRWPVMLDLFATSSNHRCTPYFTSYHDPVALGTDALLQNWDGRQAYTFPPWVMIPLVLGKLRTSSGVLMTLVAPFWPQRPWFPDLLELVVDRLVALPLCHDLLRQPHFHRHHLGIHRLSLHAWQLSRDLPGLRALLSCS